MNRVWSDRGVLLGALCLGVALTSSRLAAQETGTAAWAQPSAAPTPTPKADAVSESWHRAGFGVRKGKSKIEIAGYAQEDFRHYDWTVKGDDDGSSQHPTHEWRRFRIGTKGELGKLSFEFMADPRNSQKGSRLKDVTLGYEFSKGARLLVGHFKPPASIDLLTSAGKTDFVRRSMIGERLVPDRDWGAELYGDVSRVRYYAAFFAGDGDSSTQSAGTSGAGRLTVKVVKGLELSGSFMQGDVTPQPRTGASEPAPKGAAGQTTSGFTFWNRAHVSGTRGRLGSDVAYARGPFRIQAEYLQEKEQRKGQGSTGQDIPDVLGRGFYVQASYVLTGEKKGATVDPKKSVFQGGVGALEVVARAQALKFDDTGDGSGFAGYGNRARNIAPSEASSLEAGLNYWASNFLKFQGSALWESYNDPLIAPVPGKTGRYFTLQARI